MIRKLEVVALVTVGFFATTVSAFAAFVLPVGTPAPAVGLGLPAFAACAYLYKRLRKHVRD